MCVSMAVGWIHLSLRWRAVLPMALVCHTLQAASVWRWLMLDCISCIASCISACVRCASCQE